MKKFIFLGFLLLGTILFGNISSVMYVGPGGHPNAAGTREDPVSLTQQSLDMTSWDTLVLLDGEYAIDQSLRVRRSGQPGAQLVIKAENRRKAVIDAEGYVTEEQSGRTPNRSGIASLHIAEAGYIVVDGIVVKNSHGIGICAGRRSHHVTLQYCYVDGSYNSGIGMWYTDSSKVLYCEITGANLAEMRTDRDRLGREPPHEALTVAGATNFMVAYNEVHHCGKEGIDCKEVSAHGVIHDNYIHDMPRQGLYVDCWFGLLHDVEFRDNRVHDCEWGIAISGEGKDANMSNIRIHHNTLYDNRGSGIYFGVWGYDRPRDTIYIFNNTVISNGSKGHWAGPTGGIDIRSRNISNVFIYNNLCYDNYSFELGCSLKGKDREAWLLEKHIVVTHNHTGIFKSKPKPPGEYGSVYGFKGDASTSGVPDLTPAPGFCSEPGSPSAIPGWKDAPLGYIDYIGACRK